MSQAAIKAVGLTKSFGSVNAVAGVDLEVDRGEIFGFLGPNGAGKSTTIRMLTGLLVPTGGSARVAGYDVVAEPIQVKARIGYLAENPYAYEKLTGAEFLRFIGDLFQVDRSVAAERATALLERLGLRDDADKLVEGYSRGMRQKLGLIAALLHSPEVLFLDEPTSGLDPRSARIVKDLLTEQSDQGQTVFLSTHVLATAEQMCDRVGIIARGRLIAVGSLAQLRKRSRSTGSLEDIFLELTAEPEPAH
ncbi:MAG: ABC transporter ATP-binding protein [Actinomycetota bacterium]